MQKQIKLYIFGCIGILCLLFLGCTKQETVQNKTYTLESFQLNDKFEVVDFTKDKDTIILTIKTDDDITIYLYDLYDTFHSDNLDFRINVFDTTAEDTKFDTANLTHFRQYITYNSSDRQYKNKKYIVLPNIDSSDTLSEFTNEKVEKSNNIVTIYLTMDVKDIHTLVSELKLYKSFVEKNNEDVKEIKLIVNDTYIYENDEYIIEQTTEKF